MEPKLEASVSSLREGKDRAPLPGVGLDFRPGGPYRRARFSDPYQR